jgi:hypothetical protein
VPPLPFLGFFQVAGLAAPASHRTPVERLTNLPSAGGQDWPFGAMKAKTGRFPFEAQELDQTAAPTSSRGAASGMTRTGSERVPLQFGAGWGFCTKLGQERRAANSWILNVATPVSVEKFYIQTRSALPLGNAASGRCKAFI